MVIYENFLDNNSFENNIEKIYHIDFKYIFRDPVDLQKGLMFQKHPLNENEGALFIMPTNKIQNFWMKNTYISLDLLFLDEYGRVVGFIENTKPLDTSNYSINNESKYVIELNAGFIRSHNIKINNIIDLSII